MSFCAGKEINFNVGVGMRLGEIILPGGQLLVSGPKISFRPNDGQTVFGYEIDGKGNTTERYINGKRVSFETWQVETAKVEGLKNSNFGKKPLHGVTSLLDRKASRFLWEEKPSTPQEAKEPSTPPVEKIAKEESATTQKERKAG